jgi:vacuolar-type H+-ATPase subunit H
MEASNRQGEAGTAGQAREKVSEATSQAQEKVSDATSQAQEKASQVADQAREQARTQIDERSTQAGERVTGTADDLRAVSTELRNQGKEGPANIADQVADRMERAGSYLRDNGPDTLLHDAEDFGRRRPWAVLAGGLIAGIAAARVLKASSRDRYAGRYGTVGATTSRTGSNGAAGVSVHDQPTTQVPSQGDPATVR